MNNTANLNVVIQATDEASGAVKSIGGSLSDLKSTFQTVGVVAGLAFAGIVVAGSDAISQASGWSDKVNQLNAVIESTKGVAGETADQAIKLAKSFQDTTTFSDDTTLSVENLLLTFTAIKDNVMPQATGTVLDMATALKEDTKDAAIQLGKALQDPILGVTALRRVGVDFNADQQEVIKNLVNTGQSAQAQQLILAELNKEFGGSAAAATQSYGGNMAQLNNQINDVKKSVGEALIPVLIQLTQAILPIVQAIGNWIAQHPKLTAAIIIVIGSIAGLTAMVSALALAMIAFSTVSLPVVGIILLIAAGIAALIALVVVIIKNWTPIKDFFKSLWTDIVAIFKQAISDIESFFQPLIDFVQNLIDKIEQIAGSIGKVISAAGGIVKGAASAVGGAISNIAGHFAQGGTVSAGSSYLVGESGAELFTPSTSGTITPNGQLAGAGGSITVNINGGNYLSEDAAMQMAGYIVQKLKRVSRIGL